MNRKLILGILGVAVLAVVLPRYFGRGTKPEVTVLAVGRENLSAMISSNGKVEPLEPQVFRAPFDGFVSRVLAVEGRAVRRGELLLEMETAETAAALARAKEELVAAEEALRAARARGGGAGGGQLGECERAEAQARLLQQKRDDLARRLQLDQERSGLLVERARNDVRSLEEKLSQARPTVSANGTLFLL